MIATFQRLHFVNDVSGANIYPKFSGNLEENESIDEHEPGEPPPGYMQKKQNNHNNVSTQSYAKQPRYKCYSCDPPHCTYESICDNAIQCWKSRVRESSGKFMFLSINASEINCFKINYYICQCKVWNNWYVTTINKSSKL